MKNKLFKIIIICLLINNASTAQSVKTTIESFTDSLYKEQVLYGNVLAKDKDEVILQETYERL